MFKAIASLGMVVAVAGVMPAGAGQVPGVQQAAPCAVSTIAFPADAWPSGVAVIARANPQPTAELPFRELSILTNASPDPFYISLASASPTPAERSGSGLPPDQLPFFKLVDGAVFEWRQDPEHQIGTNASNGVPVFAYDWVEVRDETFLVRRADGKIGLVLIADRFPYLRSDGNGTDCEAGKVHTLTLSAFSGGAALGIVGSLSFGASS